MNKYTYSVECRRDSPPDDGADSDDDDDSLSDEKNRTFLGCLTILLLLSGLCIPIADNLEEVCCIYCR